MIVAQGPDILFLKDTNGDDRYDVKERMLHGHGHGRHASHGQQLRARSGRSALFPGRDVSPYAGRNALGSAAAECERGRLPL